MYLFFRMVQRFENETMKEPYKLQTIKYRECIWRSQIFIIEVATLCALRNIYYYTATIFRQTFTMTLSNLRQNQFENCEILF